jgi:phosphoribosylformimino-5-aminoimidazole carboxamide ribotide isomerase
MLIIPAIDLQDGCVVRLVRGLNNRKVYSREPVEIARRWAKQGASLLHIVDLDGASSGELKNLSIIRQIIKSVSVPIQLGGGIRNPEIIKTLLDLGVYRVILGTKAAEDKKFLAKAYKKFHDKIIVSIDAQDGKVLIKGWRAKVPGKNALDFAYALKKTGFKDFIYTDVSKDGTLKGPDMKGIKSLLRKTGMGVIVSGGVSSLDDLVRLKLLEKAGVKGVIIGKALYEERFSLTEAIKLIDNQKSPIF